MKTQSSIAFIVVLSILIVSLVLGFFFFHFSPTDQELLANYAKSRDFWEGMRSVGGWPWWTPNYLGGTSLAPAWGFMATNLWLLLWTSLLGMSAGSFVALLLCLPLAAFTSFTFLRAWTKSDPAAFLGALLYVLSPSLWMRIAAVEHLVVVAAMAVLPLTFLGFLRMVQSPDGWSATLAGAGLALLALTYSKAALLVLPFVALFWLALTIQNKTFSNQWKSPVRTGFLASLFFLGVVPLLPSIRETALLIFFEHGPFAGWQNAFSLKSAMQLLDRQGELSAGYAASFAATTGVGGFFLGSVVVLILLLAWILWYWKPVELMSGDFCRDAGTRCILQISCAAILLGIWLAAGPGNVLFAHLAALESSAFGMDWTVVLLWGMLLLACWLLWKITQGKTIRHQILAVVLLAVFLIVPGFRLLEILPMFDNIRAPFDFFQLPVPLFVAAAGGILAGAIWKCTWSPVTRGALIVLAVVLVAWDTAGFLRLQRENHLPPETWKSFENAQSFLRESPTPGAVLPVSGRYFYLLTPELSGRPLLLEAFQSYLQQRDFAWLLANAQVREEFFQIGLRLTGAAFVLLDYEDSPPGERPQMVSGLEKAFENGHFGIFALPDPLYPGFIAQSAIRVESWDSRSYAASLVAARLRFVPLEGFPESQLGDFHGVLKDEHLEIAADAEKQGGIPWKHLAPGSWEQDSYQQQSIRISENTDGWLVVTQAWHPDWKAFTKGGEDLVVGRAFGALPAIPVKSGSEVIFRFEPPFWYGLAASASVISWLIFLGIGLVRTWSGRRRSQAPR